MSYYHPSVHPSAAYSHGHHGAPMVQVVPSMQNGMGVPMTNGMPVMAGVQAPMTYNGGYGYPAYPYNHYSIGSRVRRFFGLPPNNNVRYMSNHGTWGFMGYSRRQRYLDSRTGMEVDRKGRPIYRI